MSLDLFSRIRTYPDPALATPCKPLLNLDSRSSKMADTLLDRLLRNEMGIGLAANQIGINARAFAWDLSHYNGDKDQGVLLNPVVEEYDGIVVYEEGCLSIPDFFWPVERPERVLVSGLTADGSEARRELDGIAARLFQHEIDHLDGLLIFDRVDHDERKEALAEAERCLSPASVRGSRPRRRTRRVEF